MTFNSTSELRPSRPSQRNKVKPDKIAPFGFANTILDIILKTSAISVVLGGLIVQRYLSHMGFGYLFPTILGSQGGLLAIVFSLGLIVFAICTTWFVSPWFAIMAKENALKGGSPPTLFKHRPLMGLYVATPAVLVALICCLPTSWIGYIMTVVPLIMVVLWLLRDEKTRKKLSPLLQIQASSRISKPVEDTTGWLSGVYKRLWAWLSGAYKQSQMWLKIAQSSIKDWYKSVRDSIAVILLILCAGIAMSSPLYVLPRLPAWWVILHSTVKDWSTIQKILASVLSAATVCGVMEAVFSIRMCKRVLTWLATPYLIVRSWSTEEWKTVRVFGLLIALTWVATTFSILPWVFLVGIIHQELKAFPDPIYRDALEIGILTFWSLLFGAISGAITAGINTQDKRKKENGILTAFGFFVGLTFFLIFLAPTTIFQAAMYAIGIRENNNEAHWYAIGDAAYANLMPGDNRIPSRGFRHSHSHYICAYSPFLYADKKILCAPSVLNPNPDQCVVMTDAEARVIVRPTDIAESPDEKYCQPYHSHQ